MQRLPLTLLIAFFLGLIAGWWWVRIEYGPGDQVPVGIRPSTIAVENTPLPRVEIVSGATHEFGVMEFGSSRKHRFTIKNIGTAPLKLKLVGTSCRCTLAELPQQELPPGEETFIELEWKADNRHGPFSQTATIETDDPRRQVVVLGVKGQVIGAYLLEPNELVFTKVTPDQATVGEFRIWLFSPAQSSPDEVAWEPATGDPQLTVEFSALSPAELATRNDSPRAGFLARVTIPAGAPTGEFRKRLQFRLRTDQELLTAIDIRGAVGGDAQLVGGDNWITERNLLVWGTLQQGSEHINSEMQLVLRGDQTATVKPTAGEFNEPWLKVEFGEPRFSPVLNQTFVPITLRITADAPTIDRSGRADNRALRVAVATGLPDQPKLRMFIGMRLE